MIANRLHRADGQVRAAVGGKEIVLVIGAGTLTTVSGTLHTGTLMLLPRDTVTHIGGDQDHIAQEVDGMERENVTLVAEEAAVEAELGSITLAAIVLQMLVAASGDQNFGIMKEREIGIDQNTKLKEKFSEITSMAIRGITSMATNGIISIVVIIAEITHRETPNRETSENAIKEISVRRQTKDNSKGRTSGKKIGMMGDGLVEFG